MVTVSQSETPPPEELGPSLVIRSRPSVASGNFRMEQEQQQQ
jgi:hypothetical protein